ncbi:trypsin-like peptidase domain-containing protein [Cereibacter changlensis]|uniref:Trypsin-like peptidase domain-containing protein n=1 Tax=Cereibacter changlensis TaxID=402884 RepID=A0A4U0YZM6_9RHOB|nr:serine protease [Cereibacter changlensis]TKA98380.1 trypsin-like peptidase domain-containing protein [Cereibacter changlensis]
MQRDVVKRSLEIGRSALDGFYNETAFSARSGPMDVEQVEGLESIVLTVGRPALLIRSGRFDAPPETWAMLEGNRDVIEALFRSIGRIELDGHPSLEWVGTGFMIAPGVLATNRHVVQEFARLSPQGKWVMEPGVSARVDFAEEMDTVTPNEHAIGGIIGVHSALDVALLEVDGGPLAAPALRLDGGSVALGRGRLSFVVGYPALDSRRNDPALMETIFAGIYGVKRLQPGLLTDWSAMRRAYIHDCSTLGGNSGSCLVDLDSGVVSGIHFGGRFLDGNWAISTRDLAADGYLARLGAQFV